MEEFELSFKNKYVRMFFIWVLPIIILSVILIILFPIEYQWIPSFLPIIAYIIFYGWIKFDKRN